MRASLNRITTTINLGNASLFLFCKNYFWKLSAVFNIKLNSALINSNIFRLYKTYMQNYVLYYTHVCLFCNITVSAVVLDAIGVHVKIEPLCNQKIGSHACGGVKYDQTVRFNVSFPAHLFRLSPIRLKGLGISTSYENYPLSYDVVTKIISDNVFLRRLYG